MEERENVSVPYLVHEYDVIIRDISIRGVLFTIHGVKNRHVICSEIGISKLNKKYS